VAWIIPEISAAFVWFAFGTGGGTLSRLVGHGTTDYLTTAPMLIVSVANAWRNTAFSMLVFSAGLRNVPSEVEEAAELEGASYWRRLVSVVLPIMRPTIVTNLLLLTLGNLSDFTLIFAMTQGGPGTNTAILPVYMYIQAFQFNELGYGTAIALALILLGALLSLLYVRQLKPEVSR
jgi:multiple sugar transport system permease protein